MLPPRPSAWLSAASLCTVTVAVWLLGGSAPAAAAPARNVLIVRGESSDLPGNRVALDALQAAVRQSSPSVDFYYETIDTNHFSDDLYERRLADLLAAKYRNTPLDLVVALTEPAARFVIKNRTAVFPRIPLLFGLVERRQLEPAAVPDHGGIVYVNVDPEATLRFAFQVYPSARRVVVAGGTSRTDRSWQRIIREDLRTFETRVPIIYDTDSSLEELKTRVAALPSDTIVLYASMTRDGAGASQRSIDALRAVRAASPVPIFGLSSAHLGHGIVGGALVDFERHGADVGRHAVKLLAGERVEPATTPAAMAADWNELQRFHVLPARVPTGTRVDFRETTLWERSRGTFLVVAAGFIGETTLVVLLITMARRRREAQRQLEQSDQIKGTILASLPAHVAVLAGDGSIVAVNDAEGFDSTETLPPAVALVARRYHGQPPDDALKAAAALIRRVSAGAADGQQLEYRYDNGAGSRWFLMTAEPFRGADGGAVVTHLDITERKMGELALRESEDRFRRLGDALPIAVWTSEVDGRCTYVNQQWLKMTGKTIAQEAGDGWLESIYEDDRAACMDAYVRAFYERKPFRAEFRIRQPDGVYRWFLDTGVPRYGRDGEFHGYVGGCIDITEQKNAARMLRDLNRRLMQAQDDERRRIARELHDHLSQQLALLAIDLQQLGAHPPRSAESLGAALQEAWRRTTEIASDVHGISHRLHPSKMEALGLVATVQAHCRDVSRQSLKVRCNSQNVPPGIPPDRALNVFRVVEEALSNVARHSGATEAQVSLLGADASLIVRITDNGRGFSDVTRIDRGLGLISMRERIESLDGSLTFTSTLNKGTLVEARIPLLALRAQQPAAEPSQRVARLIARSSTARRAESA